MNPQLEKIRKLVMQHRKDIEDRVDVDEPAVPRRDHNGNDITGKTGKKSLNDYHRTRRSTHRQFMKVRSESASETQEEPEAENAMSRKNQTARARSKSSEPAKNNKNKKSQITISPDYDQYGNNPLFKDGRNTNMKEEYLAWLAEGQMSTSQAKEFSKNARPANDKINWGEHPEKSRDRHNPNHPDHIDHFIRKNLDFKDGSSMTSSAMYEKYTNHVDKENAKYDTDHEPMNVHEFHRGINDHGSIEKAKLGGRVRFVGVTAK